MYCICSVIPEKCTIYPVPVITTLEYLELQAHQYDTEIAFIKILAMVLIPKNETICIHPNIPLLSLLLAGPVICTQLVVQLRHIL